MSDDERIRSLLTLAADLPDDVQPPVGGLIDRGRKRRRLRAAATITSAAVVAAAAFTLPVVLRSHDANAPIGVGPSVPPPTGPTAAELSHFHWASLPPSPLGHRSQPLLTWTGHYLIELGGYQHGQYVPQDGAAYDARTHRWHRIASVPRSLDLSEDISTWAGGQLFVANGQTQPYWNYAKQGTAALYDPAANRWKVIGLPRQLRGLAQLTAAWTGREIVVASSKGTGNLAVATYDPGNARWSMITPRLPANHRPVADALVATPGHVILWSLWSKSTRTSKNGYSVRSGVDVLSLGRGGWSTVTGSWTQHQTVDNPVYAGGQIFLGPSQIWCGVCSHPFAEFRSRLVDPATLAVTQIPAGPLAAHPLMQADLWIWTGRAAIAANTSGQSVLTDRISQLATYDPTARSWHLLPTPPRGPIATSPIWAGRQLLLLTSAGALEAFRA